MIKHLVIASTEKFNLFPAKCGISEYCSPETLVTGKVLDFEKHCQCKFGDYVQANEYTDPRNDMRTRCIDGMYLCPADKGTGHYLMDLQTGREVIRGRKITLGTQVEWVRPLLVRCSDPYSCEAKFGLPLILIL